MMQKVRAKMQCHGNVGLAQMGTRARDGDGKELQYNVGTAMAQISLGAVYEPLDYAQRIQTENAIFGMATPCGSVSLSIANPAAAEFFKAGKKYYVDFTEAPD